LRFKNDLYKKKKKRKKKNICKAIIADSWRPPPVGKKHLLQSYILGAVGDRRQFVKNLHDPIGQRIF